jgi:hypothetical protein
MPETELRRLIDWLSTQTCATALLTIIWQIAAHQSELLVI